MNLPYVDHVVVSQEDVNRIESFFSEYNENGNLPLTEELKNELELAKSMLANSTYTPNDQQRLTVALCVALVKATHPLLMDPEIAALKKPLEEVASLAEFYQTLDSSLEDPKAEG